MIAVNENIKEKFNKIQDKLCNVQELIDNIAYDLDDSQELPDTQEFYTIDSWKQNVINSIPNNCSLKFRTDVEAMLENFKSIY